MPLGQGNNPISRHLPNKWRAFLTDFFDLRCLQCEQKSASPLCRGCANQQTCFSQRCQTCLQSTSQQICLTCQNSPPAIDLLVVRWRYQHNVREWIQKAKFHANRASLQIMVDEAEHLAKQLPAESFDVIIPLPIPKLRLAQRGFNQTLFPARGVAKVTGKPIQTTILSRHYRPQQAKMNTPQARADNIKNAFFLRQTPPERVLLVDDVFTTGITLNEAAKTLKAAGTQSIAALVIAGK